MTEIFIICNSPQALKEIASGAWSQLPSADLFTCNNAFTFFRTSGKHLNFFTDTLDIFRFMTMPETLSYNYQKQVKFVFSQFGMTLANGNLIERDLHYSPVPLGASSALGALAYLNAVEDYSTVYMLGYTIQADEVNKPIWGDILERYDIKEIRSCVYKLTLKL